MHNNRYDHIDLLECMDIRWSMFNYRPTTGNKADCFIQMISCNTLGIYFFARNHSLSNSRVYKKDSFVL